MNGRSKGVGGFLRSHKIKNICLVGFGFDQHGNDQTIRLLNNINFMVILLFNPKVFSNIHSKPTINKWTSLFGHMICYRI